MQSSFHPIPFFAFLYWKFKQVLAELEESLQRNKIVYTIHLSLIYNPVKTSYVKVFDIEYKLEGTFTNTALVQI